MSRATLLMLMATLLWGAGCGGGGPSSGKAAVNGQTLGGCGCGTDASSCGATCVACKAGFTCTGTTGPTCQMHCAACNLATACGPNCDDCTANMPTNAISAGCGAQGCTYQCATGYGYSGGQCVPQSAVFIY